MSKKQVKPPSRGAQQGPKKPEIKLPAEPRLRVSQVLGAPPTFDPAIRQQAQNWIAGGLTSGSVIDRNRPGGYAGITRIDLPAAQDAINFRYWHCDDLLGSAAALIDRYLQVQVEWRDKLARSFQVECEIAEYFENEQIYADEIGKGLYEVPLLEAKQNAAALNYEVAFNNSALEHSRKLYFDWYSGKNIKRQIDLGAWLGWLNALPLSEVAYDETRQKYSIVGSNIIPEVNVKEVFANHFSQEQASFQIGVSNLQVTVDFFRQNGMAESARARQVAVKRRAEWEVENQEFKRRRMDVQRKAAEAKVGAFTLPGGALNYREQMGTLAQRMGRDAIDALARLGPAAEGLKAIYGRSDPLTVNVADIISSGKVTHADMDAVAKWARDAMAWLAAFKELDQNLVVPLSIKALVTPAKWTEGLASGRWDFTIPPSHFGALSHVRLRGVRAYVYGADIGAGFWYAGLRVPKTAPVSHGAGTNPSPLDQADVPPIFVTNAGTRSNFADVPYVGMRSAYNASPIGTWNLSVSDKSTQGQLRSALKDVEIELALTGRPNTTSSTAVLELPGF